MEKKQAERKESMRQRMRRMFVGHVANAICVGKKTTYKKKKVKKKGEKKTTYKKQKITKKKQQTKNQKETKRKKD